MDLETGSPGGDLLTAAWLRSPLGDGLPQRPHEGNSWSQKKDLKLSEDMKSLDLRFNHHTSCLNKPKEDFLLT